LSSEFPELNPLGSVSFVLENMSC